MIYMYSQSTDDGNMSLRVTFEIGTDIDKAQEDLVDRGQVIVDLTESAMGGIRLLQTSTVLAEMDREDGDPDNALTDYDEADQNLVQSLADIALQLRAP